MRQKQRNALSLVSYLFLFIGLIALLEMIGLAAKGSLHFKMGVLGIAIYAGLRRYSPLWRTCALLFTWYGIITVSIALLLCFYHTPTVPVTGLFSRGLSEVSVNWLAVPLGLVLWVTLWQYRVLTHPATRRLFYAASRHAAAVPALVVAPEAVLK